MGIGIINLVKIQTQKSKSCNPLNYRLCLYPHAFDVSDAGKCNIALNFYKNAGTISSSSGHPLPGNE